METDVRKSGWEEEIFARLPREAAELVAQLLVEAGDESSRALSRRVTERLGFSLSSAPPGAGVFGGLPFFPFEERKRKPPNLAACQPLDPDETGAWFRDGGPLSDLPGFEHRPEQERLAMAVADAFSGGRHLAAEAGTGIGKTMAYLVPAALWALRADAPVVVSTNTKNLQEQIVRKDLPAIAARLRAPLRFALVKGRSNYLCLARLERLVDRRESELVQGELPALAQAVVWAFLTPDGDLASFDPPPPPDAPPGPRLAERVASNADDCRGRKCPHWRRCFVQRARALSLAADVVVTNHAVFFSEPPDRPLALPRAAQVVFDEAHDLEDAATAHFSREFGPRDVRDLARRLHRAGRRGRRGAEATGALPELERALLAPAASAAPPELRTAFFAAVADARNALEAVALSSQRYFAALGALPPPGEGALRLVPAVLGGRAWAETVPPLQRLQDDLFRLSEALDSLARGLVPPAPAETGRDPAPRTPREIQATGRDGRDPAPRTPRAIQAPGGAKRGASSPADLGVPADLALRVESAAASAKALLETLDFLSAANDSAWTFWVAAARAPAAP
ncbi:MAG: ATP-dependent DNA helicase, partial [Kiritimatiellae bacterium]|nr:ATP-dependent DNA helicase [Kiritimatiellia bacterium]